jgi:hypothetical protein
MMHCRCWLFPAVFAVALIGACAGAPPADESSPVDTPAGEPCRLSNDGPSASGGPALILFQAVDSTHVPNPSNDAERVVFAQRYRTLLETDCDGALHDGLAVYPPQGAAQRWVFTLRDDARFEDGTALTAHDVARCWMDAIARGAGVDSARALDERRLLVNLERPGIDAVAAPGLAVYRRERARAPVGTGRPVPAVAFDGADPRDAMSSPGVMVVRDTSLVSYAHQRGMKTAALPFDRTLVLLAPSRVRALVAGGQPALPGATLSNDLALAVRSASARPSRAPAWWIDRLDGCGKLPAWPSWRVPPLASGRAYAAVYYHRDDPLARDLAERVVALSAADTAVSTVARALLRAVPPVDEPLHAVAVDADEMARRLQDGAGFAFVTSVPNPAHDSCGAARELLRRAPWLVANGVALADVIIPLVDARAYVIVTGPGNAVRWDDTGRVFVETAGEQP